MKCERILIVDDSATSRMIIKRCFEIAGYADSQYFEAEDGLKAIGLLHDHRFDLILSDLRMPKMDGSTFIKKLKTREATQAIPVIVISSIRNDALRAELEQSGVQAVIHKPISPEKVLAAMEDQS